jgi:transcriptional regulator with XRE-family HTH domain
MPARKLAEMCRTQRLQAGVSLAEMAARTHRDPSTLSRFERGLTLPKDLHALVSAYEELATRPPRQLGDPPQTRNVRPVPLVLLLGSLTVYILLDLATSHLNEAQALRGWAMGMGGILLWLTVPRLWHHARCGKVIEATQLSSFAAALITLEVANIVRWNAPAHPAVAACMVATLTLGFLPWIFAPSRPGGRTSVRRPAPSSG